MGVFSWCVGCLNPKGMFQLVNWLLLITGLIALILASVEIYQFNDEESFYSKEGYALMLTAGLFTTIIAMVALCELRKEKDRAANHIFIYWCIMSIILIVNISGFYYFRIFFDNSEGTDGNVANVVENELKKEFQDSVLSSYTACCTGCDVSVIPACEENLAPADDSFCNFTNADGSAPADCQYADLCDGTEPEFGLGSGCYASAKSIPSTSFGADSCKTLTTERFSLDGKPLVGPVSNGFSCGGGNPTQYLKNVFKFIDEYKIRILVAWGFFIALQFMAWFSSMCLILCPSLRADK